MDRVGLDSLQPNRFKHGPLQIFELWKIDQCIALRVRDQVILPIKVAHRPKPKIVLLATDIYCCFKVYLLKISQKCLSLQCQKLT